MRRNTKLNEWSRSDFFIFDHVIYFAYLSQMKTMTGYQKLETLSQYEIASPEPPSTAIH